MTFLFDKFVINDSVKGKLHIITLSFFHSAGGRLGPSIVVMID